MKDKLPRKYRIISRVCRSDADNRRKMSPLDAPENLVFPRYVARHNGDADDSRRVRRSDAPENIVSLRYVGMHNRFADDSRRVCHSDAPENFASSRYVGMHNGDADDSRRVCRSDAPENFASPRYAGMYNGFANDTKMAETLVLSGFSGGGGLLSKPRAAFHPIDRYKLNPNRMSSPGGRTEIYDFEVGVNTVQFCTRKPAKDERPPLRHPAAVLLRTKKSRCLAGSQTKKRHKLRLTCVFVMQKKVVI